VGSTSGAQQAAKSPAIEPYGYDSVPVPPSSCEDWSPIEVDAQGIPIRREDPVAVDPPAPEVDFALRLDEETRRSFEAGRHLGREEGRADEREAQRVLEAGETTRQAQQLAQLIDTFTAQRDSYLERAEHEIVKLALAVAARILRREAQVDPLLLLGAVRVALGQLAASTQVRLRVPAEDTQLWSESVALLPGRTLKPQVIGEENMRLGDCVLETDLGSVDLGVRAQLSEIERGFFVRAASPSIPVAASVEQP
jgi:flagellar assembly protein FliH